jgi:hypothetical protein
MTHNIQNPPFRSPLVVKEGEKYIVDHLWFQWFKDLSRYVDSLNAEVGGATGTGAIVRENTPTIVTPVLNTPTLVTPVIGTATGTSLGLTGALSAGTVKATTAAGYKSSDGSAGYTGTVTTLSLVGKTMTFKDGIITNFA